MVMSTATLNGKPQRKQLSQQLDRMDGLIDGLADALPEAVAEACRDGARQAVKEAVTELLTRPEFLTLFGQLASRAPAPQPTPTPAPTAIPKPSVKRPHWEKLKAKLASWKSAVVESVRTATHAVRLRTRSAIATLSIARRMLIGTLPVRRIAAVAVAVGAVAAGIGFLCPHWLSAVIGGAGVACTAAAVQVGSWLRRSSKLLGFGG
jgi:hypothetical protein